MSKTPICDKYSTNTEPHGFEAVPLYIAQQLEQQRDELLELLKAVQEGSEFTPEFCKRIDETIGRVEAEK